MTPLTIAPQTADHLAELVVDEVGRVSLTEVGKLGIRASAKFRARYLIPLVSPDKPVCSTCGGSGVADRRWGVVPVCPDCAGRGFPAEVSLVVECECGDLYCPGQINDDRITRCAGRRQVATAHIEDVLPIMEDVDDSPDVAECIERFTETSTMLLYWPPGATEPTEAMDISRLRPLALWAESRWALLATGVEVGT